MANKLPDWYTTFINKETATKLPDWFTKAIGMERNPPTSVTETEFLGKKTAKARNEGEDVAIDYATAPRGIRNNNPGNVENTQPWQGKASPENMHPSQAKETRFAVFKSPEFGIRAMGKVMQTYNKKHGLNTVQGIINRWAPPFENDTGSYVRAVAKEIGVGSDDPIDVTDPQILQPLLTAIIRHENGQQPYTPAQIAAGVDLVFNNGES